MSKSENRKSFVEELLATVDPSDLRDFLNTVQGIEDAKASDLESEIARDERDKLDELDDERWANDFYDSHLGVLTFQGPAGARERWNLRWLGNRGEETASGRVESRNGTLRLYDLPASVRPLSLTEGDGIYDDYAAIDASCKLEPDRFRIAKPEDLQYEDYDSFRLAAHSEEEDSSLWDLGLAAGTEATLGEHLTVTWEGNICAVKLRTPTKLKDKTPVKLSVTDLKNISIGDLEGELAYQSETSQLGVRWYTYEAKFLAERPRDQDHRDLSVRLSLRARNSKDILSNPASNIQTSSSVLNIGVLEYGSCSFHQGQKAREFEQFVLRFVVDKAGVLVEQYKAKIDSLIDQTLEKDETRKWLSFVFKDERNFEKQTISKEAAKQVLRDGIRFAIQSLLSPKTKTRGSEDSLSEESTLEVTKDFLRVYEILAACKDWSNYQSWNLRAFEFVSVNLKSLKILEEDVVIRYVVQASKRSFRLQSQNDTIGGNRYRNTRERFRKLLKSGKDFADANGDCLVTTECQVTKTDHWFKDRIKALRSPELAEDNLEDIRQVIRASVPVASAIASNFEPEMQSLGYSKDQVNHIAIGCILAELDKKKMGFRPDRTESWVEYLKLAISQTFHVTKVVDRQSDCTGNEGKSWNHEPEFIQETHTHEIKFHPDELDNFYGEYSAKYSDHLYAWLRNQHIPQGVTNSQLLAIREKKEKDSKSKS